MKKSKLLFSLFGHESKERCGECVTVILKGRLGNQLFQFAFAAANGFKYGKKIGFDLADRRTVFLLNFLGIKVREFYTVSLVEGRLTLYAVDSVCNANKVYVQEKNFFYSPELFHSLPQHSVVEGYFQSYLYFDEIREILCRYIVSKLPQPEIALANCTSVSVRLGDYVRNAQIAKIHCTLDEDYYLKGLAFLSEKGFCEKDEEVYVFTDDAEYLVSNFKVLREFNMIKHNRGVNYELALLMSSQNIVCANSTFSWWAAMLSTANVVVPKNWFTKAGPTFIVSDLFPEEWYKL